MTIAVATYRACPYGEAVQVQSVEMPADRLTPAAVASYLRFGGRITDRVGSIHLGGCCLRTNGRSLLPVKTNPINGAPARSSSSLLRRRASQFSRSEWLRACSSVCSCSPLHRALAGGHPRPVRGMACVDVWQASLHPLDHQLDLHLQQQPQQALPTVLWLRPYPVPERMPSRHRIRAIS